MQNKKITFSEIAKDIINTKKFNELKKERHHGLTRYTHVLRVSKITYKISKLFHMCNYIFLKTIQHYQDKINHPVSY